MALNTPYLWKDINVSQPIALNREILRLGKNTSINVDGIYNGNPPLAVLGEHTYRLRSLHLTLPHYLMVDVVDIVLPIGMTEIHQPPAKLADKLGYPRPLVDHHEVRERAIRRYKNIGSE